MLARLISILLAGLFFNGGELSASERKVNAVRLLTAGGAPSELIETPHIERSKSEWQARLTKEQYEITRSEGTERAFCGIFHDNHKEGLYACIGCGLPLFRSDTKFDSGTGWPSFFQPFAKENIGTHTDKRFGMVRTEIHCARCNTHLGHLFNDGPAPTGLRYCINSAALAFYENEGGTTERFYLRKGALDAASLKSQKGVIQTKPEAGASDWIEVEIARAGFSFATLLKTVASKENPQLLFTTPKQEGAIRSTRPDLAIDFTPVKE